MSMFKMNLVFQDECGSNMGSFKIFVKSNPCETLGYVCSRTATVQLGVSVKICLYSVYPIFVYARRSGNFSGLKNVLESRSTVVKCFLWLS